MILVADSGSTKTDWRLIDGSGSIEQGQTQGLNPLFNDHKTITEVLQKELPPAWLSLDITNIEFYGAGCAGDQAKLVAQAALKAVFPMAEINVASDLLAAARSVCGHKAGIVGILGTGSNCCFYDGAQIIKHVPPLGYVLGDEGSASDIGKAFVKLYLRNELPENIVNKVHHKLGSREEIIHRVYQEAKPNEYLASYAQIVGEFQKEPLMAQIVVSSFDAFLNLIDKLDQPPGSTINFVGSVAHHLSDLLQKVVKKHGYRLGRVVQSPIAGLTLLHSKSVL